MATANKTPKKRVVKVTRASKQTQPIPSGVMGGVCRTCNALPMGSASLVALMLVLVFSLSAVLFTSVYAMHLEQAKVATLSAQLVGTN